MAAEEAGGYLKAGAYAVAPIINTGNAQETRTLIESFTALK